jgi:4-hydroxy-tetrahydrodipicolinate reductase
VSIRVAVIGAGGRMGAEVCRAVEAASDCALVAGVDPGHVGVDLGALTGAGAAITVTDDIAALAGLADVAVDFTRPPFGAANALALLDAGVHAVIGTTGITDDELAAIAERAASGTARAAVVPNFALGAVLMMRFAAQAAALLPDVEILELHHDRKVDAPSGTALRTAEMIAQARATAPAVVGGDDAHPGARGHLHHGVPVHSIRLPGLVAHQEVRFGGVGETLTIRHDSLDRSSFMPGVLVAVRAVGRTAGLTVGLDALLDISA